MNKEQIGERMRALQLFICKELERVDGQAHFNEDAWDRPEGGGGFTRTIQNGDLIEKGGVAFSAVHGPVSDVMKKQLGLDGNEFYATGVSIVLHPRNVHVPIIHMNVRYFELENGTHWFGGGIDLTPHYIIPANARIFHERLKVICDKYDKAYYPRFKKWADEYFYIPHRQETRGIGGVFYDHISADTAHTKEDLLAFAVDLGESFPFIYEEQAAFGRNNAESEAEKCWQGLRRGRYVEFNLVNDRGTKFGLLSGGRTESILMSMPPLANWEYNKEISPESKEGQTLTTLRGEQEWL